MKYVMEIPSKADFVTAYYMEDGLPVMYKSDRIDDLEPYTEPDRKDIEDEVWEFLDFLFTGMNAEERYKCFDEVFSHTIVSTMSYQEAKAKYEAWLKRKDEIHVGDEVVVNGTRAVVMKLDETGNIDRYFTSNGTTFGNISGFQNYEVTKTNRHFPEVAQLLEKMRGEEE